MKAILHPLFAVTLSFLSLWAQPSDAGEREATSEALFLEGRRLSETGDYEAACEAFEASQELDPALGTLLNLARCYERTGRIASAWGSFSEARDLARAQADRKREQIAEQHRKRLAPRVPRLVVVLSKSDEGARVQLNKTVLPPASLTVGVPLDAGEHTLLIEQEGKQPHHTTVTIPSALNNTSVDPVRYEVPALEQAVALPPPPQPIRSPPPLASNEEKREVTPPRPYDTSAYRTWRTAGVVGLVSGGIAMAVGGTLTTYAYVKAANADCDASDRCSEEGLRQRSTARSRQTAGFITAGSGLAVFTAGILMYALPHREKDRTSRLGAGPGTWGLSFSSDF